MSVFHEFKGGARKCKLLTEFVHSTSHHTLKHFALLSQNIQRVRNIMGLTVSSNKVVNMKIWKRGSLTESQDPSSSEFSFKLLLVLDV